jgi:hypothetical protein
MGYINELAPKMMTEDEILYKITEIFHDDIPVNKGLIMKTIMPELKGKADGKLINKVVTELLG